MAQHLERAPGMKATVNLVPSLILQIEEYLKEVAHDPLVELYRRPCTSYDISARQYIVENCFHANYDRMIRRSARYLELHDSVMEYGNEAARRLTDQELRDLLVHYALAWTGEFERESPVISALVQQDREYSEEQKVALFDALLGIVQKIIPLHRKLAEQGQIELSSTPFYHPILPLICDTNVGKEAVPHMLLPRERFRAREDAEVQVARAIQFHRERFGNEPRGMWPSEGSLSEEVLELLRAQHIEWTATDEAVLVRSITESTLTDDPFPAANPSFAKYFPFRYETAHGPIALFFRDHVLSDNIGFVYQNWEAERAAEDFVDHLLRIREDLSAHYGEEVLRTACVSVILDGENCWEYYPENGRPFLTALYQRLTSTEQIRTCTMSEVVWEIGVTNMPQLESLSPGSWINANFNIWIGHTEDHLAWEDLASARAALHTAEERLSSTSNGRSSDLARRLEQAKEELLIAEGSDWCWWYGDDHHSAHKHLFDDLFRMHLRAIYVLLDQKVPTELTIPIPTRAADRLARAQILPSDTYPELIGERENPTWVRAWDVDLQPAFGAMHKVQPVTIEQAKWFWHEERFYLRLVPSSNDAELGIEIEGDAVYAFERGRVTWSSDNGRSVNMQLRAVMKDALELTIARESLPATERLSIAFWVKARGAEDSVRYPLTGWFELPIAS